MHGWMSARDGGRKGKAERPFSKKERVPTGTLESRRKPWTKRVKNSNGVYRRVCAAVRRHRAVCGFLQPERVRHAKPAEPAGRGAGAGCGCAVRRVVAAPAARPGQKAAPDAAGGVFHAVLFGAGPCGQGAGGGCYRRLGFRHRAARRAGLCGRRCAGRYLFQQFPQQPAAHAAVGGVVPSAAGLWCDGGV